MFKNNALGRISSIGGWYKTIREYMGSRYYVCAVWLAGWLAKKKKKGKICMEIWMRRYRANAPAERRSGGWTMTVQGILSRYILFFFSPWSGRIDRPLSLSKFYSIDVRIFYSEPWPIVVFVWQPRNDNHFHHIDSLFLIRGAPGGTDNHLFFFSFLLSFFCAKPHTHSYKAPPSRWWIPLLFILFSSSWFRI